MTTRVAEGCNVLFCIAEHRSEDAERWPASKDTHYDVTGYTWHEPTPDAPVIAHVYTVSP